MPRSTVILVHGLWMTGYEMSFLKRRLQARGYGVITFHYRMITRPLEYNARKLQLAIRKAARAGHELHLIGHSLGGVLSLQTLKNYPDLPVSKVICLGSPLVDTTSGRFLQRTGRAGSALLGRTLKQAVFAQPLGQWDGAQPVGVIAGTTGLGMSTLVIKLPKPNDGVVTLAETQLPGIAETLPVPVSHTGLVFSAQVAEQCHAFLQTGRFKPARNLPQ